MTLWFSLTLACAFAAGLGLIVASAQAHQFHSFASSFNGATAPGGPFNVPIGVAIDQSTGNVWVVDNGHGAVDEFDPSGAYIASSQILPPGGGGGGLYHMAVDNSGGSSAHDLYVADIAHSVIDKLDPTTGHLVASFGTFGKLGGFGEPIGVGVDNSGNLYVADYSANVVKKFDSNGNPDPTTPTIGAGNVSGARGVAIDSSGHIYVAATPGIVELDSSGACVNSCTPLSGLSGALGVAVDPATQNVYAANGGQVSSWDSSGNPLETFGSAQLNGAGLGIAVRGLNVYVGNYAGNVVDVFAAKIVPDAITNSATNVSKTTATFNGHVDLDAAESGGPITACQFEYVDDAHYNPSAPDPYSAGPGALSCSPNPAASPPGSNFTIPTDVAGSATGLTADTTYHYRVFAANANGIPSYGKDQVFTTYGPPFVHGESSTNVADTTTTVQGQIDPSGFATTYHFDYVTDATFQADVKASGAGHGFDHATSTAESASIGVDSADHPASADLSNLQPNATYHYRVVATNTAGSADGSAQTFATYPSLPTVDGTSASGPTQTAATLNAQVNPGFGLTIYRFEYGTDTSYGSSTLYSDPIGSDGTDHAVVTQVSGLTPATTYHFRVRAINFSGFTVGPDQTFNTTDVPLIASTSASAVTQTAATLGAQINPNFSSTTYHFEFGRDASYGSRTRESASIGSDHLIHPAAANISGLVPATTYHYRLVATNADGISDGPDQTFTTVAAPPNATVPPPPPTKCKTGFVKKQGKCVRKHQHKKHHKRSARHG